MATYKVIDFNESTGQLTIEYAKGMSPVVVDVPLVNDLFITGEELENYIKGFIPFEYLDRQAKINAGVSNAQELKSLIETNNAVELPTVLTPEQERALANQKMWEEQRFESSVAKVLVKFGVLTSDPTTIPVNTVG